LHASDPQRFTLKYSERPVGNGSFGYVFEARVEETGQRVAVKKVYQDPGYKNRELPIMQMVGKHPNVVELVTAFKSRSRSVRRRLGADRRETVATLARAAVPHTGLRPRRRPSRHAAEEG